MSTDCVSIPLERCSEMSEEGKCAKCSDESLFYLSNGMCCPFGRYWDAERALCLDNPFSFCKKYQNGSRSKCTSCPTQLLPAFNNDGGVKMNNTLYLIQDHCCNQGYFWVESSQRCESKIDHCSEYLDNKNADGSNNNSLVLCKTCKDDFTLTPNKRNCCPDYSFYDEGADSCISNERVSEVYQGCIDWNEQTLLCSKCDPTTYYLSSSPQNLITLCCHFNSAASNSSKKCEPIDPNASPHCNQKSSDVCIGCEPGYALKTSSKTCVKITDFCTDFNAETGKCIQCDSKHYLSQNMCCSSTQFGATIGGTSQCVSSTPTQPQIPNCLQYDSNNNAECALCLEKTYLSFSRKRCVPDMKFWNGSEEVAGNVQFCEHYGETGDECLKCISSHSLMTAKEFVDISIDQNLLTSSLRAFYADHDI